MNRSLLSALPAILLVACSAPASEETSSTEGAATATAPVAEPVDGTYKASCSNKYGSVDLSVDIADGAVTKVTATLEGRDGKFRVGVPVVMWKGTATGNASHIDASLARVTITSAGAIDYSADTMVMQDDEETIKTTNSCAAPLAFSSIEIVPHDDGNRLWRSVVVHGVKAGNETCGVSDGPLDEHGDWSIECSENEGAVSSSGLDLLAASLRGAKQKR